MIKYYLFESFNSFKSSKLSAFVTIVTTAIAIIFIASSILILFLTNKLNDKLANSVELTLFLSDSVNQNQINKLNKILKNDKDLSSVKLIDKEEAKNKFISETGENFSSLLEINPLPYSFVVKLKRSVIIENKFDIVKNRLSNLENINEIVYDYDYARMIYKFLQSIKLVVYILSLILISISIYLIIFTNKLVVKYKKDQFDNMKLVGARLKTIKIPLFINSISYSLVSSVLAIIFFYGLFLISNKYYSNLEISKYFYLFNLILLSLGCFLGIVGAFISTSNISLKINNPV